MINLVNPGPPISEHEVAKLEDSVGHRLSAPYRRFLLNSNGGAPGPVCLDVPGFGETDVQVFFGIGRAIESSRIDWNIEVLKERLDSGLIPIASDSGGNVFCLSLRSDEEGAVVYCDLESVYAQYGKVAPLFLVAPDFDRFMSSLRSF